MPFVQEICNQFSSRLKATLYLPLCVDHRPVNTLIVVWPHTWFVILLVLEIKVYKCIRLLQYHWVDCSFGYNCFDMQLKSSILAMQRVSCIGFYEWQKINHSVCFVHNIINIMSEVNSAERERNRKNSKTILWPCRENVFVRVCLSYCIDLLCWWVEYEVKLKHPFYGFIAYSIKALIGYLRVVLLKYVNPLNKIDLKAYFLLLLFLMLFCLTDQLPFPFAFYCLPHRPHLTFFPNDQ